MEGKEINAEEIVDFEELEQKITPQSSSSFMD
jgi:hypothetical protein